MASRVDSLQDIFGPSEPSGTEALETAAPGAASSTTNLDEFDDIFASSTDDAPPAAGPAGDAVAQALKSKDTAPVPGSSGSTDVSPGADDFEDIFGDAPTADEGGLLPSSSIEQTGGKSDQAGTTTTSSDAGSSEAGQAARPGKKDLGVGPAGSSPVPVVSGGAGGDDSEFLDFLYDDDKQGKAAAAAAAATVTPQAEEEQEEETAGSAATITTTSTTATTAVEAAGETISSNPGNTSSPRTENPSPPVQPTGVSGASSPSSDLDSVPLGSPLVEEASTTTTAATTAAAVAAAAERLEVAVKEGKLDAPPPPPSSEMCFVRKEKVEVLSPLPEDPASALRELASPETTTTRATTAEGGVVPGTEGVTTPEGDRDGPSAASDVGYVRRLCAASGGFLPPDLRSAVWGLLLGLGRKPEDAGFVKWREARRRDPSLVAGTATVAYMLDLRNDCLALARRLCDDGGVEGGGGAGVKGDPEALAVDIEEVLAFYCSRRSEAYEPVLCALVGPLFSMGLDPSAVSAMLSPLVGSLTLFLGRGLTHTVRDLAWVHAHRRLHDLCTYHDPELVQHLTRCFPGWEMPLPAASVSRAETSALDQEAAAMVDDLESSLPPSLQMRRLSVGSPAAQSAAASKTTTATEVDGVEEGGRVGQGQGVVEPSLLVAANAGLGASAPLGCLLPLWDYLLIRHDKHFGFFLLVAALLRRRDELLALTGPHLRLHLAEILSPAQMATVLSCESDGKEGAVSKSPLVLWCEEAEALDLATPESFRHHLGLIGEIAEAEHEAIVRTRARKGVEAGSEGEAAVAGLTVVPASGGGAQAVSPAQGGGEAKADAAGQAEADPSAAKGLSHPSILRVRSLMKNAGDKLAADLKNLKLARSSSGQMDNTGSLAAPIELSLPQLCLAVSAKEVVTGVSSRGRGLSERGDTTKKDNGEPAAGGGEGGGGGGDATGELFRTRQPLFFFVVDCRPKEQVDAGRFPTAFHLDPSSMDNPEEMAESIMPVFEPLRRRAHVCLVGSGDGHMRARGLGTRNGQGTGGMGSQKAARDEYSYVNTCALFFMKRGFPYVSVLEGGFAAAHELVMDTADRGGGDGGSVTSIATVIVDHDVTACRLCLAQKPAGNNNASTASPSAAATAAGVAGGLLFPLSPPLWARIGAADSSEHGPDKGQGQGGDKGSPFFSPKLPLGSSNGIGIGDGNGGGAVAGKGPSDVGGVSTGEGGGVSGDAVGDSGGGGGSAVFKAGAMFRGMNMNMGMFKAGAPPGQGGVGEKESGGGGTGGGGTTTSSGPVANGAGEAERGDNAGDLASKFRVSFARFGGSKDKEANKEAKKDDAGGREGSGVGVGASAGAAGADKGAQTKDSGFGSLFRKAQAFKAADVAAAWSELRDGPKASVGRDTTAVSTPIGGVSHKPKQVVEVQEILGDEDEEEDDGGGLFVIGDDGSEASETPDSDFEGFDGEHRPHSTGGARSMEDKELALLEHRLSGQIKGATMVVDDFLKVPGAKVFSVTKHKVTYHDVDPNPTPAKENASGKPLSETQTEDDTTTTTAAAAIAAATADDEEDSPSAESKEGFSGDMQGSGVDSAQAAEPGAEQQQQQKRLRVRAVTELERVVFLSRERILVLACPEGFGSPGLVKSNHHLTELQKMTFMRRDPTLVTLHYLAHEGGILEGGGGGEGVGVGAAAEVAAAQVAPAATKRNVYRFEIEDKEAFIRIIRSALQRFQT